MTTKATKKETAAEPKKTVKKETAAKTETAAKAETVKAETAKKETVKEVKAAPAKKAEKTEAAVSVVFEFADKKVIAKELLAKAKESFAAAHKDVVVEEMNLYINANDGFAYLVVNGTEYPEDKIEL